MDDLKSLLDVKFDGSKFLVNGKSVEGLHSVISATFFPFYDYKRAIFGKQRGLIKANRHRAQNKEEGMEAGKKLDDTLGTVTKWLQASPDLNLRHFCEPDLALPASVASWYSLINECRRGMQADARQICCALLMHHLRPIRAQFPVGHELLRIGTAIDLLCKDQRGDYVVVEIKRGFDVYYEAHTEHTMQPPWHAMNDSPHNQHQIQLGLTLLMFCRTTGLSLERVRGLVLRTMSKGVMKYPLEHWVRNTFKEMQMAITIRNNGIQRQKNIEAHTAANVAASGKPAVPGVFIAMKGVPGTLLPMQNKPRSRSKSVPKKKKKTPANGVDLKKIKTKPKKKTKAKKPTMEQRVISEINKTTPKAITKVVKPKKS